MTFNFFCNYLLACLNKYIKKININKDYLRLNIDPKYLTFFIKFLALHTYYRYNLLVDIACYDKLWNAKRFELNYILLSLDYNSQLIISLDITQNDIVSSLSNIFNGSNWMEREIWDMYGIFFFGHNDLRRILTDYGFEGYPFRKDFPLNGYLEIRYDENKQYLIYEPIELMQNIRYFNFINPLLKKYII